MTPRAPAMPADQRRAAIIAATVPLLREKGRAVSTREIARAAGVAEGTIFRVFPGKDELIAACVREAFDTAGLHRELAGVDLDQPLRERLAAGVGIMQSYLRGIFTLMTVLQATGQRLERPHGSEHHHDRRQSTAVIDADFVALIGADADRLRMSPEKVVGYLRMVTLSSVHPMLESTNSTAEEIVDVILDGTLDRPAELAHAATAMATSAIDTRGN